MSNKRDYFKLQHGRSFEEATRIPTASEILNEQFESHRSRYPLRVLQGAEDSLTFREEERESHMHIIGTTGEGKSRFLEWLIRGDIDRGNGLCFLDPSDRGDTLYRILAYCQKIGHKKVLLIDPHHRYLYNKICPINPFLKNKDGSVANVSNTLQILFDMKDMAHYSFIQQYLPALLAVLYNAKATLRDAKYFTRYANPFYTACRYQIINNSDELDDDRITVEEAFTSPRRFVDFGSTARRLLPACRGILGFMFGSQTGIDFAKLISDKWVVLVNLYPSDLFEIIQARLLGTMIINQLIAGLDRLAYNGWRGRYYLYLDEAGFLANRKIVDVLTYKRKSGLSLTFAHQYYGQVEDLYVRNGIKSLTKIKVAFNQPDPLDRLEIVKTMFGGDLKDRDVSYALSNLRKQHCVIKKPKQAPMIVRVPDVPNLPEVTKEYIQGIYAQEFYRTPEDILKERNESLRPHKVSSTKRAKTNKQAVDDSPVGTEGIFAKYRDTQKAQRSPRPSKPDGGTRRSPKKDV